MIAILQPDRREHSLMKKRSMHFGCFVSATMNQWFICYHKWIFFFNLHIVLSMYLNVWNEDWNLLYDLSNNKFQISLLLVFIQWNRQFHHQVHSLQIHNYKYLNSRLTFSFILQKPQMLLKEGNRFWEEGLPYGKQAQEKSKHRIKHTEKYLWNKSS